MTNSTSLAIYEGSPEEMRRYWRNHYAGLAMQEILDGNEVFFGRDININYLKSSVVVPSFRIADAMLAEMEAREGRQDG